MKLNQTKSILSAYSLITLEILFEVISIITH